MQVNKFGHTKICFSTVDHNAYGSLSRTKRLALPGFFHGILITVAVLKLLVPSGVPDLTFPCHGVNIAYCNRTTTSIRWSPHHVPKLINSYTSIHYMSMLCNPTLSGNCMEPRIKCAVDIKLPCTFLINPCCWRLCQMLVFW